MQEQRKSEADHIAEAQAKLLEAALAHVPFDGWSEAALALAVAETGVDKGLAKLAFPRGGIDMALAFHRAKDAELAAELGKSDLASLRIRDRVTHCVRRRIELIAPHRDAVRRAVALLALPMHAPEGARAIWQTADIIWNACGDTATDYNHYTKRGILASVYSATVLYWMGDNSPGFSNSWAFLDRRIEDVMRFEKTKAQIEKNPLAQLALWGPMQMLKMVRAPGAPRDPAGSGPVNSPPGG